MPEQTPALQPEQTPDVSQPASVVTTRLVSTRRIIRLPVSLTNAYTVPPTAPMATAVGELNFALVPVASAQPAPSPAPVPPGPPATV